jgi:hypothetical protein
MPRRSLSLLIPALLALAAAPVSGQNLEELLVQVGQEYAEAYTTPLIHGFGANQNSGLYHTANIPRSRLTWSVGIKFMGTYLDEGDQTFRRVLEDVELNDYLGLEPGDPGYGERGDIVLQGPTVLGDKDTNGTATAYVNGAPVFTQETIPGLVDTRWVPLFAPEATVGGIMGLRATVRWLPEIDFSNYGKTKYLGYGLQWSPSFLFNNLPVDVMVGFFMQDIDLGTMVQTEAESYYIAASKGFGPTTVYGGLSAESSNMKVDYVEEETQTPVKFDIDGKMKSRLTLGATFNLGVKLNAEMGIGKMVVYTAGIMFGM